MCVCVCVCVCVRAHMCVHVCLCFKEFHSGWKERSSRRPEPLIVNQMKKKKRMIVEEQKKSNLFFSNSKMIKPCLAARYFYISKMNKGLLWG